MRKETIMGTNGVTCALCGAAIPSEDAEGCWCHGCNSYICEEHPGFPLGNHDKEEHIEPDEDPDDDLSASW